MKEKIKKRVKLRVKIYSVYIVFEDDSGNYAEFNCGDFIESEQAIERWKNLYRQCEDVPYHFRKSDITKWRRRRRRTASVSSSIKIIIP